MHDLALVFHMYGPTPLSSAYLVSSFVRLFVRIIPCNCLVRTKSLFITWCYRLWNIYIILLRTKVVYLRSYSKVRAKVQTNRRYLRNFETGEQKVVVLPQIIYSDLLETRLSSLRWRKFNVHNVSPVKALDRSLSSGIVSWPIRLRFLGSLSENNLALKRNSETPTHLDWKEKLKLLR